MQENPPLEKKISRCSACRAIILEGVLIPKSQYDPLELIRQGYSFSDGYLSQKCARVSFSERILKRSRKFQDLPGSCPK